MKGIYTIDEILLALHKCPKFRVDIKTPPTIDGDLDDTIVTIEVKMFLNNLNKNKDGNRN